MNEDDDGDLCKHLHLMAGKFKSSIIKDVGTYFIIILKLTSTAQWVFFQNSPEKNK